ncbi:MAG: carbohydrate binding family 9 domain-containing protein [Myxococcaceae bacterium]|nr:carbohydrate binding family 9 domain-containing protein [Myxococcaceae bacterium]
MLRHGLALALWLSAVTAGAAVEGPGRDQFIQAAPARGELRVDGKLDEASWAQAPVFSAFVQRYPLAGAAPSERTELRVLYDSERVYFGIIARDSQPGRIDRRLGRRDSFPATDSVQLIIDSTHDHRTAYAFSLSAGGVHGDGLFYDDRNFTTDWDGVWDGATSLQEDGWVAEFAIPLSVLRFPEVPVQTWGFSVRRQIARLNEELESVDNPRTSNANVSRLGHLTGLEGLVSRRKVELVPYLASRGTLRPQFSDSARPFPRLVEPTLDVGLDVKAALTSDLSLNATLNPDFGQVEADQLILNLSTFEAFFPEKRPFFTQGLELFQPVGGGAGNVSQSLFYSRRIGLETPVLGAAKLTGTLTKGVEVGVLDALVTGPWQAQDEERPDRQWRLHSSRPLHLSPNSALPGRPQPATNFLAAVARGSVGENSRVGGSFAAATPLVGGCSAEEAALDEEEQPAECLALGGLGAAADFDFKTASSEYGVLGQVDASRTVGGLPERTLRDGTVLRRGASGYGGYLRAGKFGGEGFRWQAGYDFASPALDLNAAGFQRTQNEHASRLSLGYQRPNGFGPFRALSANLAGGSAWTSDGRGVNRGSWVNFNGYVELPSSDVVGWETGVNLGGYDVRELDGTGIPLEREHTGFFVVFMESNANRALALNAFAVAGHHDRGPAPGAWGWAGNLALALRPHPALETRLEVTTDRTEYAPRLVEELGDSRFLLGNLQSNFLSLTLRQQWVLRPHLTLQGYAQLFSAYGRYGPFYEAQSDAARTPIRFSAMRPTEATADDFYDVALNLNVVLRWEYRLGSTLFLVYTRSQQGLPTAEGEQPPATVLPRRLWSGPAVDAVLLKWSYYWTA